MAQQLAEFAQLAARYRLGDFGDVEALPLRAAARAGPLPLPMRVELFWQRQQYRATVPMHLHTLRRIDGSLDQAALHDSVAALMQRHEALRTRLALRDGVPCQLILSICSPQIEYVDLRGMAPEAVAAQALTSAAEFITRPMDLLAGPTFRVLVMVPDDRGFILGVVLHHYFGDGRSMEIVTGELLQLYASTLQHLVPSLAPVSHQYADYALWQRQLAMTRGAGYIANLRRQLGIGESASTATPAADTAGSVGAAGAEADVGAAADSGRSGGVSLRVGAALAAAVNKLAQSLNVSPAPLLLAAHQDAVRRWSGRRDETTAVPFAARTRAEYVRTAGYLINAMPIPAVDGPQNDMAARIGRIRRSMLNALLWQDLSYELLEDCVCMAPPLCRTMFNFIPLHAAGAQLLDGLTAVEWQPPDLLARIAGRSQVRVMADFVCYLRELPGDFACDLLYNADRFAEQDLRDYGRCLLECLRYSVGE